MQSASNDLTNYALKNAFFFTNDSLLINGQNNSPRLPFGKTCQQLDWQARLTYFDNDQLITEGTTQALQEHAHLNLVPIKSYLSDCQAQYQQAIIRAKHLTHWHQLTKYCGHCATALDVQSHAHEKICSNCDNHFYPRYSPAVMLLIYQEDKLLLARSPHFKPGVYSAIAGFVDIGESAEDAAIREAKEELGLTVSQLQYFKTQAWPFPDSFMMAFKTNDFEGEIKKCPIEIEDAKWFKLDELPKLPMKASISRQLIDSVINQGNAH